jgi:hypothetical protein
MAGAMAWELAFAMLFTLCQIPMATPCVEDANPGFARMFGRPAQKTVKTMPGQGAESQGSSSRGEGMLQVSGQKFLHHSLETARVV